jgi:hypothetical protein
MPEAEGVAAGNVHEGISGTGVERRAEHYARGHLPASGVYAAEPRDDIDVATRLCIGVVKLICGSVDVPAVPRQGKDAANRGGRAFSSRSANVSDPPTGGQPHHWSIAGFVSSRAARIGTRIGRD